MKRLHSTAMMWCGLVALAGWAVWLALYGPGAVDGWLQRVLLAVAALVVPVGVINTFATRKSRR